MLITIQIYACLLLSLSVSQSVSLNEAPTLKISQGSLVGRIDIDYYKNEFYSYEGIPYAKPPIRDLRFKAPQDPEPWEGILNATEQGDMCSQLSEPPSSVLGSEDCLFLNVYTTQLDNENINSFKPKPVMVWIHGGAFKSGTTQFYNPGFLISKDIVLVTIQYRLNIFGFLSIEDPSVGVPGNAGLKDQVMALKWVQKNIQFFGGDPNIVTIFGESAGSASTHLLALSSLTKGLFHRVISQSGTAMCPWVSTVRRFDRLSERLGCGVLNQTEMFNCLSSKSVQEIQNASINLVPDEEIHTGELVDFAVVVELPSNESAFLSEPIEDIIAKGKFSQVPWLIGYNTNEGQLALNYGKTVVQPNFTNNELLVPNDTNILFGTNEALKYGDEIKNFYYGSVKPSLEELVTYVKYETDVMFLEKIYRNAKQQAALSSAPVYFYHFAYNTTLNMSPPWISHGDDLMYMFVFPQTPKNLQPGTNEYEGIYRLTTMWTNFAKTGNPNPETSDPLLNVRWEPIQDDIVNYLEIKPQMQMKRNPERERMTFWENLYASLNRTIM